MPTLGGRARHVLGVVVDGRCAGNPPYSILSVATWELFPRARAPISPSAALGAGAIAPSGSGREDGVLTKT